MITTTNAITVHEGHKITLDGIHFFTYTTFLGKSSSPDSLQALVIIYGIPNALVDPSSYGTVRLLAALSPPTFPSLPNGGFDAIIVAPFTSLITVKAIPVISSSSQTIAPVFAIRGTVEELADEPSESLRVKLVDVNEEWTLRYYPLYDSLGHSLILT